MPCSAWHTRHVIRTWRDNATRRFAETGEGRFPGLDVPLALARLQLLDAITKLAEVPALRSIALHKLKRDRHGQWAMTINGRWRLVFAFRNGHAYDVEIVDYHGG
jgi:proteic killer suppression protein